MLRFCALVGKAENKIRPRVMTFLTMGNQHDIIGQNNNDAMLAFIKIVHGRRMTSPILS